MALRSLFGGSVVLLLLAGCSGERDQVPGNIESGSIQDVTDRIDGFGSGPGHSLSEIGVIPITGNVKPVIPLIKPPEVVSFYVFPRKSRDGRSMRDGFYIHRVIKDFSWGVDDAMHNDRLKLSSLMNLRLDESGQLVVDQQKNLEPTVQDIDGLRDMAKRLPWRPSDATTPVTRTTVVYPSSGTAVSTTQPSAQAPTYLQPNGGVNLQEIQRAMSDAQKRVTEMQQQKSGSVSPSTPSTPSTPPIR
ncbi:MAG TPA: hypothetical protein VHX44_10535 [Planctomycetota bacterium]|nr:hypothetical protein [Planctomycetota bacterium]